MNPMAIPVVSVVHKNVIYGYFKEVGLGQSLSSVEVMCRTPRKVLSENEFGCERTHLSFLLFGMHM